MTQSDMITTILITILSILGIRAQSVILTNCQTAVGMSNVNVTQLTGIWYEEIRVPAKNVSCVQINVSLINNQTQLNVKLMYSASQNGLLMDKLDQAIVNVSDVNANRGFNVSYSNAKNVNITYKILSTDYNSNAILCGYTNLSDANSSFGIILTREQIVNPNWLMEVKNNASQILGSFNDTTVANITQSHSCHTNSAGTTVPVMAILFAAFYTLLKFLY